jgi:hypothetical protein
MLAGTDTAVPFKKQKEDIAVSTTSIHIDGPDTVIVVELK